MSSLRLFGRVVTPRGILEDGVVEIRSGVIARVERGRRRTGDVSAGDGYVVPGFIDLHVHGGGGADFMAGTPEAVARAAKAHAQHGTTGLLATTVAAPREALLAAIRAARSHIESTSATIRGARVLGVHLEGPYINPRYRGAQEEAFLRPPDAAELAELADAAAGALRLVTLAPELPGALACIAMLRRLGVRVAAGHTAATYAEITAAARAGLRHVTHLFNAMRGLHHREPGTVGAALELPRLTCELIADGIHVEPAALRLAVKARGRRGVVLITDAMMAAGLGDGEYRLGPQPVSVRGGAARLADGTLAGSVLTMDRAVANMVRLAGVPLPAAVAMASLQPARALGLQRRKGSLEPGKDADVVVLDGSLRARLTLVEGQVVYDGR